MSHQGETLSFPVIGLSSLFIRYTIETEQVSGQKPHLEPGLVFIEFAATDLVPMPVVFALLDSVLRIFPADVNIDCLHVLMHTKAMGSLLSCPTQPEAFQW